MSTISERRGYSSNDLKANNKTLKQICMLKASTVNHTLKGEWELDLECGLWEGWSIVTRLQASALTVGSEKCALGDCSLCPDPLF